MRLIKISSNNEQTADFTSYFSNLEIKKNSKIALKNIVVLPKQGYNIDETNNVLYVSFQGNEQLLEDVIDSEDAFEVVLNKGYYKNSKELLKEIDRALNQSCPWLEDYKGCAGLQFYAHEGDDQKCHIRYAREQIKNWTDITLDGVSQEVLSLKKTDGTTQNVFNSAILSQNYFSKGSGYFRVFTKCPDSDNRKNWIVGLSEHQQSTTQTYDESFYDYYMISKNGKIYAYDGHSEHEITDIYDDISTPVIITVNKGKIIFRYSEFGNYTFDMTDNIKYKKYFIHISLGRDDVVIPNLTTGYIPKIVENAFHRVNLDNETIQNFYDDNVSLYSYGYNRETKTGIYFTSNLNISLGYTNDVMFLNQAHGIFSGQEIIPNGTRIPAIGRGLTVISNNLNVNSFSSIEGNRQNIIAFIPSFRVERTNGITYLKYQDDDLQFLDLGNEYSFNLSQLNIRILDGDEFSEPLEISNGGISMTLLIKDENEK